MWTVRFLCFIVLIAFQTSASGQTGRYVVFLKDKDNSPYALDRPGEFLSSRSLSRRSKQQIPIVMEDLPVNPDYVTSLAAAGFKPFYTSRWSNCVIGTMDATLVSDVQALPFVTGVELVAPGVGSLNGRVRKFKSRKDTSLSIATQSQLSMLGVSDMHGDGLHGEGILIAVFDSGYEGVNTAGPFEGMRNENRIAYQYDFVGNSAEVYQYDDHGTEVLSVMAAWSPGVYEGGAYEATYGLFITEDVDTEYKIEEYNWLCAAERADSLGADIINSSLGYNTFDDATMDYTIADLNGKTAVITKAASAAIARGMFVVCSAGNEATNSWKKVTPPADAVGILAVGAVTINGTRSGFSSIGPTADNRIKPDVVALGSGTAVIRPNGTVSSSSGTSLASPLAASLAAGIWQGFPYLTSAELYDIMIHSASMASSPDNERGYGIPNYTAAVHYIEAVNTSEDVYIYPNPAMTQVQVVMKKVTGESIDITLFDSLGRALKRSSVVLTWLTNPLSYDISDLSSGIYFLTVRSSDGTTTTRLVKE